MKERPSGIYVHPYCSTSGLGAGIEGVNKENLSFYALCGELLGLWNGKKRERKKRFAVRHQSFSIKFYAIPEQSEIKIFSGNCKESKNLKLMHSLPTTKTFLNTDVKNKQVKKIYIYTCT